MSNKKKKTINDMPPGWWEGHLSSPMPSEQVFAQEENIGHPEAPTPEEVDDALRELSDINCVGVMVGDLLKAIEKLSTATESTEKQKQILRRLRPLVTAANFYMRKAGMIAYDEGIRPMDE